MRALDDAHAAVNGGAPESVDNRLPAAVQVQHRGAQCQLQLLDRGARTLVLGIVGECRDANEHLQEPADACVRNLRVEPRGERFALDRGSVHGWKARLHTRELELAVQRQRPGGQQRGEPRRQRVPAAPEENEAAIRAGNGAANVDPEDLQGFPQVSGAIQRVRAQIEDEPVFGTRRGPAADCRRFLEQDDGQAGPGDKRRGDEPRQPTADDHDWKRMSDNGRVMKSHTFITSESCKKLQPRPRRHGGSCPVSDPGSDTVSDPSSVGLCP